MRELDSVAIDLWGWVEELDFREDHYVFLIDYMSEIIGAINEGNKLVDAGRFDEKKVARYENTRYRLIEKLVEIDESYLKAMIANQKAGNVEAAQEASLKYDELTKIVESE